MSREDKPSTSESNNAKIKETLDFLLHSYRAKLAVDNPSENCPFDFTEFLENWRHKYKTWDELRAAMIKDLEPLANEGLFDSILPYLTASLNQSEASKEYNRKPGPSGTGATIASLQIRDLESTPVISAELTPSHQTGNEISTPATNNGAANAAVSSSASGKESSAKDSTKKRGSLDSNTSNTEIEFDPEIVIHVCDEAKSLKKDFYCLQSILVKEMGYFTKVTVKGQRLRDMDISVHCDISVFEWLMKWVKSRNGGYEQPPVLDAINVIGLMVSADFLQMTNLVSECLDFTANHIGQIINQSPNLGCLNESLTNRILQFFDNFDLETRINHIDKTDRITSRLYTQLIMALNDPEPDERLGHFASTATLFRCNICGQLLINNVASKVPCCTVKCDCRGRIYACHIKDPNWNLGQFIKELKKELKLWKKVYWRLWALVHFFCCSHCQQYFAAKDFSSCRFHPSPSTSSVVVVSQAKLERETRADKSANKDIQQARVSSARRSIQLRKEIDINGQDSGSDTIICPYGIYPCCKQPSYQFNPFPSVTGCDFRDHSLSQYPEDDPALKLINAFRELIVVVPTICEKKAMDWAALIDLTPQKLPSTSSTASVFSQRAIAASVLGLNDMANRRRIMMNMESSSTESNSLSDNEENLPKTDETYLNHRYSNISDTWSWNPEYTTRYNQDMQREREEKLMADLEMLLAQRVAIDSNGSSGFPSTIRLGYFSRRTQNNGGSYLKLEEKWKDEIQQSGTKTGKHTSKFSKS